MSFQYDMCILIGIIQGQINFDQFMCLYSETDGTILLGQIWLIFTIR